MRVKLASEQLIQIIRASSSFWTIKFFLQKKLANESAVNNPLTNYFNLIFIMFAVLVLDEFCFCLKFILCRI